MKNNEEIIDDKDKDQTQTPPKNNEPEKKDPPPAPPVKDGKMDLAGFLDHHTLPRSERWRQERLHRRVATERKTKDEWTELTGIGKEGK